MQTVGFESITVTDTAVGFTSAKINPSGAPVTRAFVTVEVAGVRFRADGTDPTATTGHLLSVGDALDVSNTSDMAKARFIRTGSTSAVLAVSYLR